MNVPIWLVRHGEASASWAEHADPGLSDLGHKQARVTADFLQACVPERVQLISSPKRRAQETAAPLADKLGLTVSIATQFDEIAAPVPLAQRQEWLRAYMGQTWQEQSDAVMAWRNGILAALDVVQQPAVIFCHFLVINTVVAHIRNHAATLQFWPDNGSCHQFHKLADGKLIITELGREMATPVM